MRVKVYRTSDVTEQDNDSSDIVFLGHRFLSRLDYRKNGTRFPTRPDIFSFVRHLQTDSGSHVNFNTKRAGRSFSGVKQPVRVADHTSNKLTKNGAMLHSSICLQSAFLS